MGCSGDPWPLVTLDLRDRRLAALDHSFDTALAIERRRVFDPLVVDSSPVMEERAETVCVEEPTLPSAL